MRFMGFGFQNWIYVQRHRTAFSSYEADNNGTFKGIHKKSYSYGEAYQPAKARKRVNQNFEKHRYQTRLAAIAGVISLVLLLFMGNVLYQNHGGVITPATYQERALKAKAEEKPQLAYNQWLKSGDLAWKQKDYATAVAAYKEALVVDYKDKRAYSRLSSVYAQSCYEQNKYCAEAEQLIHFR